MRRYIIVGMGVSGIAAAEAIRSIDNTGHIVLVSDDPHGYYSRPGLAYYLTGEITERLLFPFSEKDFLQLAVERQPGYATRILVEEHELELQDALRLTYDRLLIATGARATPLKVPGAHLQGVVKLDSLEDARQLLNLSRKARTAVVVGGGITALELVEGLSHQRLKVHYFLRGDRYWGNVLDQTESRLVERFIQEHGVKIEFNTELVEIIEKRGHVVAVRTRNGRLVECELLAYAIGVEPCLELAHASGLRTERGILVDEFLQTSAQDVFAAGDVAQVFDPFSGRAILDSLWGPARSQGNAAGRNMAGETTSYQKFVPFNVTRLANLTTTIIGTVGGGNDPDLLGIARGDSETWRQLPDAIATETSSDVNHFRIVIGERTILGAIIMGEQILSRPLQDLIAKQVEISPIRQQLLLPNTQVADLLLQFWQQYRRQYAP